MSALHRRTASERPSPDVVIEMKQEEELIVLLLRIELSDRGVIRRLRSPTCAITRLDPDHHPTLSSFWRI
jgi:hypothetical protein